MTQVCVDAANFIHHCTGRLPNGLLADIHLQNGAIASVGPVASSDASLSGPSDELFICPGFLDLQVNGFAGVDLNADEVSPSDVVRLTKAMWATGVTSFLPTIITGSFERLGRAMTAVRQAIADSSVARCGVLGIHLEGPYLSSEDGPRGAHELRYIRDPDWGEFEALQRLSGNNIKMVTVAPERPRAAAFIRRLVDSGVVVAIGHTAATEEQIEEAVRAGARVSTHLGNGSHPLLPRHDNYIWAQLAQDRLWASLIADGQHLPPSVLKSFVRAKQGKVALVSDAVHLAGLAPGVYETNIGGKVELLENGRLQVYSDPRILAGAAAGIDRGVQNIVRHTDLAFEGAIRLVTENPAAVIGAEDRGRIAPGQSADLTMVLLSEKTQSVRIAGTVVHGELVYADHAALEPFLKPV